MIIRDQKWNDGQQLKHDDLNAITRALQSQLWDFGFGALDYSAGEGSRTWSAGKVFCLGNGGAPTAGGADRSLAVFFGTILQDTAGAVSDGSDVAMRPFVVPLSTAVVHDDNTSGFDRIDLVQVKITNPDSATVSRDFKDAATGAVTSQVMAVTREATADINIKKGISDGSLVIPTPDTGYATLATVRVQNGIGANPLTPANITDHRFPLGTRTIEVIGRSFGGQTGGSWVSADQIALQSDGNATPRVAQAVHSGSPLTCGRLLRVGLSCLVPSGTAKAELGPLLHDGSTFTSLQDLASSIVNADGSAHYLEAAPALPMWMNGYRAGVANEAAGTTPGSSLGFRFTTPASQVCVLYRARFIVAGM